MVINSEIYHINFIRIQPPSRPNAPKPSLPGGYKDPKLAATGMPLTEEELAALNLDDDDFDFNDPGFLKFMQESGGFNGKYF